MTELYSTLVRRLTTSKVLVYRLTLFFLCGLVAISASAQTTRYVNASAATGGTGTSWATAYKDLQAALDVAVSGDEIRVAKGTYKPSKDITSSATPADPGTRTFLLKNGIKLYGGYDAATGTRNVTANLTILSGDYSDNDKDDFTGFGENAYHVVVANGLTTTTELDGFTIKGGDATRSSATFIGLTSGHYYGGGLLANSSNYKLIVSNCRFTKNRGSGGGGGIYNNWGVGSIRNCIIDNNQGNYGSGIYNESGVEAVTISNSVIINNGMAMTGGGIYNTGRNLFIVNTTIFGNKAQSGGAGISHPYSSSYTTIKNSIIWGNAGGTMNGSGGVYVITSTMEGGGYGSGNLNIEPSFNRMTDPDGADNVWGTADDGLHLRTGSPSADKGTNAEAASIATDITGAARVQNGTVNLGAYETLKTHIGTLYVNTSAAAGGDGGSWATAFNNLQDAIDYAVDGDEIWVAKGTYKPTKDVTGNATPAEPRTKTFLLKDGVKVYGGFAGTETILSARNIKLNKTVLSGDLGTVGSSTDNSYHVVAAYAVSATTALDGFIVTDGNATSSTTFLTETNGNNFGGGLFTRSGDLVVSNCFFVNNYATSNGSGIVSFYGQPKFINSVVSGNSGLAAIRSYSAAMTLTNCTVAGNSAFYSISSYASSSVVQPTIKNSIIWGTLDASMISFSHSNVMASTVPSGTGNSILNAAFFKLSDPDGADNIWGTADDGLVLRAGSPGTNAGNDADVPTGITTDIIGDARKQGLVNMGAYETLSAPVTIYVNGSISTAGDGSSWATAFKDLQSALEVSGVGDQIWVAKGTYKPTKNVDGAASPFDQRTKTFLIRNGVKVYGGFAGTESTLAARNATLNKTILTGDLSGNDLTGWVNYGDNSYHVVAVNALTAETVIDGFTITGGNANGTDQFIKFGVYNDQGAGIIVLETGTNLTVSNNVIIGNQAEKVGGGIFVNQNSPATIFNCIIANNKIINSTWYGGGVFLAAPAKLINCVFAGNVAGYYGGAIYMNSGASNPSIINCTISGNSSGGVGGGIYNGGSNPVITNTISWANTSFGSTTDGFGSSGGSPVITYSNIHSGVSGFVYAGTGNKNENPLFINSADLDGADNIWGTADDGLVLNGNSPSANTGNDAAIPTGISTDIIGDARIQGTVNMGAYETVKLAAQVISGLPATATKTYGDVPYTLSGTGGGSGNPIVYTSSNTAVATVSGNTVTIVGAGTTTITANQAGNSTYDPATAVTQTLTVSKRAITVKADAVSKEYGDADPALTYTITAGSLAGSDKFTGSLTRATGDNGGYQYAIFQGTLALNSNYNLTYVSEWLTINKRAITVTPDAKSKTYGDADPALTYTVTSGTLKSGDGFTGALSRASGNTAGTYAITIGSLAINSNYTITLVSKNLTINKRAVTVTANKQSKVYGNSDPSITYTVAPALLGSDGFSGSLGRTPGEVVGTYAITIGTLNNNNYSITLVSNDFTIEKRVVTVTADALSKTYGTADPATLTYSLTAGSLYASDGFTGKLVRTPGEDAGTYAINQGTLALNSNYTLNYVSKNFTINKRAVAVKADVLSITYGDAEPTLTYKITSGSLKSGEDFTGTLSRATGDDVGTYAINQGSLVLTGNYDLTFTGSTLTIGKRAITVTVDAVSKTYGDADPALTYKLTVGTLKSGDSFTGALSRAVGDNVGAYAISQNTLAVNSNYNITFVGNNLTIGKRTIAVKADAKGKTYGDTDPALTYTLTSGSLKTGDNFTGALMRATGEPAGTYAINQGTLAVNSNYTINYTGASFTIDKKTITVTADAVSKVYGDDDPALTYKVAAGSLVDSDVLTGNLIRAVGNNVGTYTITVGTLKNSNYNISFIPNSLTISKRAITIKAADASKSVSQTKAFAGTEYTIAAGSLASGDAITGVTLSSAGAASSAAVGSYTIVPSAVTGITASNYNITYVNGTLTVTAKPVLTVKAVDASKVYGAANPAFTYTITGFVDGDNQATATTGEPALTTSVTTTSPAGTYSSAITAAIGTLASSKYEFSFVNGSLTVDTRAITVTADVKTKEYGDADPALTYTVTSGTVVSGDSFTGALNRTAGESIGAYAIDKGTLDIGSNYTVTFVANNLTIGKRNITVTADAASKVYGGLDPTLTYKVTAGSLKSGDAFTGGLTRVAGENAGTYAIEQGTLALNANYNLTFVSKNLTIGKRFITITADAVSKTYGDADPALTYTVTSGALKVGDVLAGSLSRATGDNVGTYAIAIGTINNPNYNITFVGNNLTISKRAITVTADAKTKTYGDTDPALTYKITAGTLKTSDALTGSLNRATGENAGTYAIGVGTLTNSNYAITYIGANLTIDRKPITVTANAVSKVYGESDPALTYTATALLGSDVFSGGLSRATGENVGTYAINKGTLTTSDNYLVAFVAANLTIGQRDITVTADAQSKTYGDADPALTYAITSGSLKSGDALTGSLVRVAGEDAGSYAINAGTLAVNSNYKLSFVSDNLTIGKRAVTVTANAQTKVYGETDPALTYAISSGTLVGSDVLTGSLSRATGEGAGTYVINMGTLSNANYNISFAANNLTIGKRAISVTADAQTKVYGEADPALTYNITAGSLVGTDAFTGSLSRATGENAGTYAINQNTLALTDNYTLSFTGADLNIAKRAITIKANDATKGEGLTKTFAGTEYSISAGSLAAGDAITNVSLTSTGAAASAAIGSYDIVPSNAVGISAANYTITYVNGTLTVTTCPAVTITTQPVSQVKCAGADVTFEVVATGTGLTYQWYKGSDKITNATSATYTITGVTAAHAGDYKVEVVGCSNVTSTVASLTVNTVATPTITASGNVLTSSATTGNQWYLEGASIAGATAQTYEVQAAGRYTVKVTVGSCSATSAEFNFVPTRIDGPSAWSGDVIAYPNPVGKTLYIKNNSSRKLQLQLVDVAGVSVRTATLVGTQGSIPVEGLASGTYYLLVTDQQSKQTISFKLIKL